MTNEEFQSLVLAEVQPGEFKPMVTYNPGDDSLELLATNESYVVENTSDRHFRVYIGRQSGDVTGILINRIKSVIRDIESNMPDIELLVHHNGKLKMSCLFKAIRENSKTPGILTVMIKQLEKVAEQYNLEANFGETLCSQ